MRHASILTLLTLVLSSAAMGRSIFLNGTDISSSRSQDLKGVTIHIDESGDVFITAPNYQVNEEDSYIPLSKYVQGTNVPAKGGPAQLPDGQAKVQGDTKVAPGQPAPVNFSATPTTAQDVNPTNKMPESITTGTPPASAPVAKLEEKAGQKTAPIAPPAAITK